VPGTTIARSFRAAQARQTSRSRGGADPGRDLAIGTVSPREFAAARPDLELEGEPRRSSGAADCAPISISPRDAVAARQAGAFLDDVGDRKRALSPFIRVSNPPSSAKAPGPCRRRASPRGTPEASFSPLVAFVPSSSRHRSRRSSRMTGTRPLTAAGLRSVRGGTKSAPASLLSHIKGSASESSMREKPVRQSGSAPPSRRPFAPGADLSSRWRRRSSGAGIFHRQSDLDRDQRHLLGSQARELRPLARGNPRRFVFSVKGGLAFGQPPRARRVRPSVERFFASGVVAAREGEAPAFDWLFCRPSFRPPTSKAFLKLLPAERQGHAVRHVVEVAQTASHARVRQLLRAHGVRHQSSRQGALPADFPTCRPAPFRPMASPACNARPGDRHLGMRRPRSTKGGAGARLERWRVPRRISSAVRRENKPPKSRDVFIYMNHCFTPKAPAAAMALI